MPSTAAWSWICHDMLRQFKLLLIALQSTALPLDSASASSFTACLVMAFKGAAASDVHLMSWRLRVFMSGAGPAMKVCRGGGVHGTGGGCSGRGLLRVCGDWPQDSLQDGPQVSPQDWPLDSLKDWPQA